MPLYPRANFATRLFLSMKIYTRKGDAGQTGIWRGRRLSKDHVRMEAIGAVDECNAAIGSVLATGLPETLSGILRTVQGRLFIVGSELMAPDHAGSGGTGIVTTEAALP